VRIFSSSGCSLGPTASTEGPLSCFDSGRVHPNLFFQQAYAFTLGFCPSTYLAKGFSRRKLPSLRSPG
jgi:hypothetical protein